ncbi:MAG: hypothetical protein ACI8TA_002431 [Cyclobacteriaceae bacterium]|jgi:hypothetical protein
MNVVTKEDRRNGQFGNVYGGYGTNDLYKAGFTINSFNKDQRFTVLGISNNINQQNFSNQDLAGIGGGGRGGSRSGASESIMTGTLSGITTTHSLGINYSDNWKENTKVEGSYFYNQTDNTNNQNTYRESFLTNETQFYNEEKKSSAHNLNHRLNFRIDHKINENNNILLRSTSGYQDNNSLEKTIGIATNESGEVLNETRNNYSSINTAWNISNNMTYQHKFNKIGRTISVDFGGKINPIERRNSFQALEVDSLIDFNTEEIRNTLNSNITYTEPIGNTALLSASYDLKTNKRKAIKDTYLFEGNNEEGRLIPELSSHFSSGYTTQVSSVSYANRKYGNFINASLSYQNAQLNSEQVFPETSKINTPFNNLLASVMGRFELNENTNAFLRYRTTTDEPSISQLQTVIDNTNPLFISVGNLALKQSYSHDLMLRFSTNNIDKNITFSNFTNIKNTLNYITNSTIILKSDSALQGNVIVQSGAQISQPVNLNGYWNVRNSSTLGVLISPIKTNLNTTMGLGYSRLPGLTNEIKNLSNTYSADWRIGLSSNISENFDFNIFYNAKGNRVINSIQNGKNTNYVTQTIGGKMNIILAKNYVFRSDIYHLDYNGVNQNSDTKYTLWNMSLARKFLKNNMGEMAFTVFDLLGENQSINQKVTASYLEETQTKVLQRYFMFTFTYKLRKFKSAS